MVRLRYAFHLGGRDYAVTLVEHADGPRFVVEGHAFQPKVERLGKGHYGVSIGTQRYEFRIQSGQVLDGARPLDLEVRRDRPALERTKSGGRRNDGRVKPPMPGRVLEVRVKEGQSVQEGDVLCVLEAMKMQNDIKSPHAGKVARIHVRDGATVESSTVLLEIVPGE